MSYMPKKEYIYIYITCRRVMLPNRHSQLAILERGTRNPSAFIRRAPAEAHGLFVGPLGRMDLTPVVQDAPEPLASKSKEAKDPEPL